MKNKDVHKHLDEIEERLNEKIDGGLKLLVKISGLLLHQEAMQHAEKHGLCGRFPDSGFLAESPTEPPEEFSIEQIEK